MRRIAQAASLAVLTVVLTAGGALAQDGPLRTAPPVLTAPSPAAPVTPGVHGEAMTGVPHLGVAVDAPTCGDIPLSAPVTCVTAPLAAMSDTAQIYIDHYKQLGWIPADGDEDRIVMIKRRDGGGCDAMQMIAFYDTSKPDGPQVPGYLGFATIPGDICAAPAGSPPAAPASTPPASTPPASTLSTTPPTTQAPSQ